MICVVITDDDGEPLVHVHGENLKFTLARALRLKQIGDLLFTCKPVSVKIIKVFER